MKLIDVARRTVPADDVLAAGIFQAAGSMTARMAGFGELSVRQREEEERRTSGLQFKRYMLLVVTPARVHLFDARSAMARWKARERIATWERSALRATTETLPMTIRLTLEIPSQNRRLELEAPKARRSTAGEVARLLAPQSPLGSGIPPVPSPFPRLEAQTSERRREQEQWAGIAALLGGLTRLLAYTLPWIVVKSSFSGRSIGVSGNRELGVPLVSFGLSVVIMATAIFYLVGRREASPRLLFSLGLGSVIALFWQVIATVGQMGQIRTTLRARGLDVTTSLGFGIWIELVGVALIVGGGYVAYRLWKQDRPHRESYLPHRPDLAVPEKSKERSP